MNTFDTLLIILLGISYLTACFFALRALLHLLQLSSYQLPSYFHSLPRNRWTVPSYIACAGIGTLLIFTMNGRLLIGLLALLFAMFALLNLPKKAKKPLVFTTRLVRIFMLAGLVPCACFLLFALHTDDAVCRFLLIGGYAFTPLLTVLARLITAPVDFAIRKHYINDAKTLLKSCPSLKIIGITGSFGKTSVKHYLCEMLSERFETLMTPGSFNTPMGVVRTIREKLRPIHEVFICEMGARHVGDIKEICDIVHPDLGIVTSIGEQHLETFKSLDNIKRTKLELADSVALNAGHIFLNGDCLTDDDLQRYPKAITYGKSSNNSYCITEIKAGVMGMSFSMRLPDGAFVEFETGVLGEHSALNIAGAAAICIELGMKPEELRIPIKRLKSVPHRLEMHRLADGILIDDSFNSNPSGSRAALNTLKMFDGAKLLITPGMVELGAREEALNREFGLYAAGILDYAFLVGKLRTRPIYEGLIEGGFDSANIIITDTFNEAIAKAHELNLNGKRRIILIENDLPDNY